MTQTDDESQIAAKSKELKSAEAEMFQALSSFLETKGGRRWAWRLLSLTRLFQTSFTGNSKTFFNEGERNVGLQILNDLEEADPGVLSQLRKEFKDD